MSGQLTGVDLTLPAAGLSNYNSATLGSIHVDDVGRSWQFCQGAATIAQFEYVKVSSDGLFTLLSLITGNNPATEPCQVGCVQVTGLTASTFCWVFRGGGLHTGKFAASCVQNVKILSSGTAGVVDDAGTAVITGLKLITTIVGAANVPAYASGIMQSGYGN